MMWRRYIRRVLRLAPSALVFLSGVGAVYIADVVVTRYGDNRAVADWAVLKSFMMIGGTFALFGISSLLFREPSASRLLLRVGILQAAAVALVAGVVAAKLGWAPSVLIGAVSIAGFALTSLAFQWLRSQSRVTEAYIASSAWRVLFLAGVVGLFIPGAASLGTILLGAFVVGGLITLVLATRRAEIVPATSPHNDVKSILDVYRVGGILLLTTLSLSVSSYGETLVVNHLGSALDVAMYYRAAVVYVFPGIAVSQYVVTILEPFIREHEHQINKIVQRHAPIGCLMLVAGAWPALLLIGWMLEFVFYGRSDTPLVLAALLSFTTCVRLYYILPSSYVGILAGRQQLLRASIGYLASALLLPISAFALTAVGLEVLIAVAVASLINWTLRSLIGTGVIIARVRKGEQLLA